MKTAVIAGSSGLIGRQVLNILLEDEGYSKVISLGRSELGIIHPKLEQRIVDFDHLDQIDLTCDDVFCCLGTTMKKAGSQANFRKVDFNYPHNLAARTLECGAGKFLLVSSLGADPGSNIFYNRIKGETEQVITQLQFQTTHIFRPSILLGHRSEFRLGETIGKVIMMATGLAMIGPLKNYKPVKSSSVAVAMVHFAKQPEEGLFIHESSEVRQYTL
jgi:uncharacterized protein YbjT (DUF2867 family)